jgi:predicted ArsR family transcriptional regulator
VTDGNLGRHLEVLQAAGLVSMSKSSGTGRGRTWVKISRAGREALRREIEALRQMLTSVAPDLADDQ